MTVAMSRRARQPGVAQATPTSRRAPISSPGAKLPRTPPAASSSQARSSTRPPDGVRGASSPKIEGALPATGWAQAHATDGARMWVRDRLALTRDALDRLQHRPAPARTLQRGL